MGVASGAAWPELWVPATIAGHIFAAVLLLKAFFLTHTISCSLLHTCGRGAKARSPAYQAGGKLKEEDEESGSQHVQLQVDCGVGSSPPHPQSPEPSTCKQPAEATQAQVQVQDSSTAEALDHSPERARWKVAAEVGVLEWRNLGCSYTGGGGTKTVLQVGARLLLQGAGQTTCT